MYIHGCHYSISTILSFEITRKNLTEVTLHVVLTCLSILEWFSFGCRKVIGSHLIRYMIWLKKLAPHCHPIRKVIGSHLLRTWFGSKTSGTFSSNQKSNMFALATPRDLPQLRTRATFSSEKKNKTNGDSRAFIFTLYSPALVITRNFDWHTVLPVSFVNG